MDVVRDTFEQFGTLYDQGIAVGHSDIAADKVYYRFHDEIFEFPTSRVPRNFLNYNGYFYTAKVEDLRALKAELEK